MFASGDHVENVHAELYSQINNYWQSMPESCLILRKPSYALKYTSIILFTLLVQAMHTACVTKSSVKIASL